MPQRVVDLLEPVQVDQQDGELERCRRRTLRCLRDTLAKAGAVGKPGEVVVVRLVPDLVDLPDHASGDAGEQRHEQEEEHQQHELEDPRDREEGIAGGPLDRPVVLVDGDGHGRARERQRHDGAEHPQTVARAGGIRNRGHVAGHVIAPRRARLGRALAAGVARPEDGASGASRHQHAVLLEQRTSRGQESRMAPRSRARAEVACDERVGEERVHAEAGARGRRPLGLHGVGVTDEAEDRCRAEAEAGGRHEGEAEDEPRRASVVPAAARRRTRSMERVQCRAHSHLLTAHGLRRTEATPSVSTGRRVRPSPARGRPESGLLDVTGRERNASPAEGDARGGFLGAD